MENKITSFNEISFSFHSHCINEYFPSKSTFFFSNTLNLKWRSSENCITQNFFTVFKNKLPNLLKGGSSDNKSKLFSGRSCTQKVAKPFLGRPRYFVIAPPGTWADNQNQAEDSILRTTSLIQLLLFSRLLFHNIPSSLCEPLRCCPWHHPSLKAKFE